MATLFDFLFKLHHWGCGRVWYSFARLSGSGVRIRPLIQASLDVEIAFNEAIKDWRARKDALDGRSDDDDNGLSLLLFFFGLI